MGSAPRSGGHSYAGYSTAAQGVVLDLRKLKTITVHAHAATATVGAGIQGPGQVTLLNPDWDSAPPDT